MTGSRPAMLLTVPIMLACALFVVGCRAPTTVPAASRENSAQSNANDHANGGYWYDDIQAVYLGSDTTDARKTVTLDISQSADTMDPQPSSSVISAFTDASFENIQEGTVVIVNLSLTPTGPGPDASQAYTVWTVTPQSGTSG